MKRALRMLALMSVWLGACGGEDQPPGLQDYDTPGQTGLGSGNGAGDGSGSAPQGGGGAASGGTASGGTASGGAQSGAGSGGNYIPTPVETDPPDAGSMNAAGQAGASSTPPLEPCSMGTWTGDFSARSSAELQPISGYTRVTGTLYVGVSSSATTTDVTSLAALSCLEQVDTDVSFIENHNLRDLQGLERLALVGGRFTVSTNAQLTTLEALSQLVVGDVLHIRANPQLTTLGHGILSANTMFINENAALPQCLADALALELGLTCNCEGNFTDGICP